ncbi:Crp/Fnr family transcriptional regulator [Candidatus Methylospira mobilis]|uniref:Crp/Fnr family transcriptional regulator n=1 Tax=Candidatus Methylospira mobilis TaxID=1808979 RepID=A0A5Q0BTK9_9GAMM|nr:Crp/Fnr family transcriptional regulator [Candidatus Methylospira mobilis]
MLHLHSPKQNRILAALSAEDLQELLPCLSVVYLKVGGQLADSGQRLASAYFPIDSVISLFYSMKNGESAGVTVIGNEGMFSVSQVLGGVSMPYWATVEAAGHAFQVNADVLDEISRRMPALRDTLLLYAQASLTQIAQSAVCSKHHSLNQQLCQHLLLICDKSLSEDFRLTHETIASMLGARRESVTEAAGQLREQGLIDYNRGRIRVRDRVGLEQLCCECYGVVREEFTRLLGG